MRRDDMGIGEKKGSVEGFRAARVGVDVVVLPRVKRSLERHGSAFLSRFLTPEEALYCRGPRMLERVAGRLAAKEAVMKVLGRGWPAVSWTDIAVLADSSDRPAATLSGKARTFMDSLGLAAIDVSITHDGDLAIAVAIGVTGSAP